MGSHKQVSKETTKIFPIQLSQQFCQVCGIEDRTAIRDFSSNAVHSLVTWGEASKQAITDPMCHKCYKDLRDILVERADEIITLN